MPPLYCLTKLGKWDTVGVYPKDTYDAIVHTLNSMEGKGRFVSDSQFPIIFSFNNMTTKILKVVSERFCTVAFCVHTNTYGSRYMVYGTKYNQDSNYGIGIDLDSSIIKEMAESLYPGGNTVKY